MTAKAAFTDEEWDVIALTPVAVGLAVAKAGRSGLIGSVRETKALVETIDEAQSTHPVNEVVQAVVADDRYPRSELIGAAIASVLEYGLERVADLPSAAESMAAGAIEDCTEVTALLDRKATAAEATDYRQWILEIARHVAESAVEDGVAVSEAEAALIDRITVALGA